MGHPIWSIAPGNTPALVTVASEPDLLPLVAALAARTESISSS